METTFFLAALVLTPAGVAVARRQVSRVGSERSLGLALLDLTGLALAILAARAAATTYGTDAVAGVLLSARPARRRRLSASIDGRARCRAGRTTRRGRSRFSARARCSAWRRSASFRARCSIRRACGSASWSGCSWSPGSKYRRCRSPGHADERYAVDAIVLAAIGLVATDVNPYTGAQRYDYDFFLGPVNAMRHGHRSSSTRSRSTASACSTRWPGLPRRSAHLPGAATGALRRVRGRVRPRLCGLAARCTSQVGRRPRARHGARRQLAGPLPPFIGYPSTGPLRFGLPWIVILAGMLRARSTKHRRLFDATMVAVVAVGAVWSIETFAYCLAAYVAITATSLADSGAGRYARRLRRGRGWPARSSQPCSLLAATSVVVLVFAGDWPELDRVPQPRHALRHAGIRLVADPCLVTGVSRRRAVSRLVRRIPGDPACRTLTATRRRWPRRRAPPRSAPSRSPISSAGRRHRICTTSRCRRWSPHAVGG